MATPIGDLVVNLGANTAPYERQLKNAERATRTFSNTVSAYQRAMGGGRTALKAADIAVGDLTKAYNEASRAVRNFGRSSWGLQGVIVKLGVGVRGLGGWFKDLAVRAYTIGKNIIAATAAFAALGFVGRTMAIGEEFERSFRGATAVMGDLSEEMTEKLKKGAFEVARATVFSAKEAAEGYEALAQAGLSAAQSIEMLPQVAAFAQAGSIDMKTASDYLMTSLYALKLPMEDVARVADVLTATAQMSIGELDDFAAALKGPFAGALRITNKSLEEGAAVLGAYAQQGLRGSEASYAGSIMLRDLQRAALRNAATHRELHDAVYDTYGVMKDTDEIIGWLEKRFGGLSVEQRAAAMEMYGFQEKSKNALLVLLGSSEEMRKFQEAYRSQVGITAQVAAKKITDMQEGWAALDATWTEGGNNFMQWIGPGLSAAMKLLSMDTSKSVTEMKKELQEWAQEQEERRLTAAGYKKGVREEEKPGDRRAEHLRELAAEREAKYIEELNEKTKDLIHTNTLLYNKGLSPLERYTEKLETLEAAFKKKLIPDAVDYKEQLRLIRAEYEDTALAEAMKEYESVWEKSLSPMDKYKAAIAEVNTLFKKHVIDLKKRQEYLDKAKAAYIDLPKKEEEREARSKSLAGLERVAERAREKSLAPMERYKESVAELDKLYRAHEMTLERYKTIKAGLAEEYIKGPAREKEERRLDDLRREAEKVREATLTPAEELSEKIKSYKEMYGKGMFGKGPEALETYRRAVAKATEEAEEAAGKGAKEEKGVEKISGAMEAGSAEAWSTIMRGMGFDVKQPTKGEKLIEKRLKEIKAVLAGEKGTTTIVTIGPGTGV